MTQTKETQNESPVLKHCTGEITNDRAMAALEEIILELNCSLSLFQLVRIAEILEQRGFDVPASISDEISYLERSFEEFASLDTILSEEVE